MIAALRPAITVKTLLIAAGVLLGLLAVALITGALFHVGGQHGITDAATLRYSTKLRPLGVLWH